MKVKGFRGNFETKLTRIIDITDYSDQGYYPMYSKKKYSSTIEYNLCPNGDDTSISLKFQGAQDSIYDFKIDYFSGKNFFKFYSLFYKKFGNETDLFGKIIETFDGQTSTIIKQISSENLINCLVYALKEMFICIEEIVDQLLENTVAYCFIQKSLEECLTYEEYIHNVACKVILQSSYYLETVHAEGWINFIESPRKFCPDLLE